MEGTIFHGLGEGNLRSETAKMLEEAGRRSTIDPRASLSFRGGGEESLMFFLGGDDTRFSLDGLLL